MAQYWVTFRLASDQTYQKRYDEMLEAMTNLRTGSWGEPTSFWSIFSDHSVDAVCKKMSAPLKADKDLLIVGIVGQTTVVYFGSLEYPAVFKEHFPAARKLG